MEDTKNITTEQNNDCFIIMPITDPEGYDKGHFKNIYEDIFKPACVGADLKPIRADDVNSTNLIHLDIIERLVTAKMAICDLSSLNPNVLFELGIRQAIDMPTVLVQEEKTPSIFDIAPLKYFTYRNRHNYREVLEDQKNLTSFLEETLKSIDEGKVINSIVSLLSIKKRATLKEGDFNDTGVVLNYIMDELNELKNNVRDFSNVSNRIVSTKENDENYRNILILINELKEMISFGTPMAIVTKNWDSIYKRIANIEDTVVRTALMRDLEELKRDYEKYKK